ncbi:MAG: HAD family hydrolase [Lentisphaeria bacterium]|nr:HAD family hydrolase [Lentisphaeria bacterium]
MLFIDPEKIPAGVEKGTSFTPRRITHVFHDIDGTHSLIRQWVPVMALVTGFTAENGFPDGRDMVEKIQNISRFAPEDFPEGRRFAIESAGLSALTQMEWALRCAAENGKYSLEGSSPEINSRIIKEIWLGKEEFDDYGEAPFFRRKIAGDASVLFKVYELLLLKMGRDNNLADAKINPEKWRVPGSLEFLKFLHDNQVKNYFVTGAVVEYSPDGVPHGTMVEEITALGMMPSENGIVSKLAGSTWQEKLPKEKIMSALCRQESIDPSELLIVGDGRSEIAAGVALGALTMSRLDTDSIRAREIHQELGTNMIVSTYEMEKITQFMSFIP